MKKYAFITILAALIVTLGSVGMAHAEIIPPWGEGQIGLRAEILCAELTLRKEPNASSEAVKTLKYGDFILVQPQTGGWARCFLGDEEDALSGWVNEDYLAIDPAWYRTEGKTPVYAWNDTMAPKVALLDENTTLPILKEEGEWLIVSLRGATGWIQRQDYGTEAAAPVESMEIASQTGAQAGERFEDMIMFQGMADPIRLEHVVNDAIGIEMDYDYELFERRSEPDREFFALRYEDPEESLNYIEVSYSAEDADTVAASISEELSDEYDVTQEPFTLDNAGNCIWIDASCVKGTNEMHEFLQEVFIIPAGDGCVVARTHQTTVDSEGLGLRMRYIINTLVVRDQPQ